MANKRYEIAYLSAASIDLIGILQYIAPLNPTAARRILGKLDSEISKLNDMPNMGKSIDDDELGAVGYRVLIVEKHYVFYVVKEAEEIVYIHRVLAQTQDYTRLIK